MRRLLFPSLVLMFAIGMSFAQTATESKQVYFDGEGVVRPGVMHLSTPTHLLEAITSRGGLKPLATNNKIRVLREGRLLVFERAGQKIDFFTYSDMTNRDHPESNPLLMDGDHIII
jgi:protein involved in polysaccharide export with SLBB domain